MTVDERHRKNRSNPPHLKRGGWCGLCWTLRRSLHRDHIVPRSKGGGEEDSNIQYICANCHEDKTREDLKGRKYSPETIERMRNAQLGKNRSPQHRERLIAAARRRRHSDETKAKISAAHKGKTVSPETIAKRFRTLSINKAMKEMTNCLPLLPSL